MRERALVVREDRSECGWHESLRCIAVHTNSSSQPLPWLVASVVYGDGIGPSLALGIPE